MDHLNFTVDSALLRELGEKLVETVHLALVELVKNAYDADATQVKIEFSKNSRGEMQIIISDNGIGMNFETIKNFWMRVATNNKSEQKYSKIYGRPLSGEKGIGRFSCRRLGGHLKIITKGTKTAKSTGTQNLVEQTIVEFPWLKFIPGKDLTSIKCPGSQETLKNATTGTQLIISNISDEWSKRGYDWLNRQLAVLSANRGIKRQGYTEDPGFDIKISAPDFDSGKIVDLRLKLMKSGWGTLTAEINKKRQAVCKLDAIGIGKRAITSSQTFPHLEDVKLELAIMVDDRSQIRDTSILSLGTLQKILDEWGGVQVRYKGVRVYPYGDDDWLGIDRDRGLRIGNPNNELHSFAQTLSGVDPSRSLLNMLSMRSYVGNVEIGETAKGFEPKLSREGFVSSSALEELKEFVRYAIDWSTILRDYYIREEVLKIAYRAKEDFEDLIEQKIDQNRVIESAILYLNSEAAVLSDSLPPQQRKKFTEVFESATDLIQKQYDANQVELAHLRLVASTSTLLLIFSHEVKSLLGVIEQNKNSLEALSKELLPKQQKEVAAINDSFTELKDRLFELLSLTSVVGGNNKKLKPGQVALKDKIIKVEKVFELITNKYQIEIDHSGVPNNISFRNILEAEVYSILLNVISNSIKSVIAAGKNRRIELVAKKMEVNSVLIIRDTGVGIDESRFEEVFIPFISDPDGTLYKNLEKRLNPEDSMIVGSGSGLGLGIVKEIVNVHGGSIKFKKPTSNWKTELEIKLP